MDGHQLFNSICCLVAALIRDAFTRSECQLGHQCQGAGQPINLAARASERGTNPWLPTPDASYLIWTFFTHKKK